MGRIVLVTGGARSGKSSYAEESIKAMGKNIAYLATAVPFDEGMRDRILKHQNQRPAKWKTFEFPVRLYEALEDVMGYDAVLVDCVTVMLNNYLFETEHDWDRVSHDVIDAIEVIVIEDMRQLVDGLRLAGINAILVTNEVGFGIVPENRLARLYRDMAGRINQALGAWADDVILVVCGQPLKIK